MDTLDFAKILVNTGEASGRDRKDFEDAIAKIATETRLEGESPQQGFTRVMVHTEAGRLLYKASRMAPPRQAAQDLPVPKEPEPAGPASKKANELARELSRVKGLTFAQAYARVIADRRDLYDKIRAEEIAATRAVRDSRAPVLDREFDRDFRLGHHAGQRRLT